MKQYFNSLVFRRFFFRKNQDGSTDYILSLLFMLVVIVFSALIFLQSLGLYELNLQKEDYISNKWNSFYDLSIQDRMQGYEKYRDQLQADSIMFFYEVDKNFPRLLALESDSSHIGRLPIYRLDVDTDSILIDLLIGKQFEDSNNDGIWNTSSEDLLDKHSIYLQKELMTSLKVKENDVVMIRSAYASKNNSIKDYKFPLIVKPINGKTRLKSFIFYNYIDGKYDKPEKSVRYEFSNQTALFNFLFKDLVLQSFPTPFYIGHGVEEDYSNNILLYYDPNTEMEFDSDVAPNCDDEESEYYSRRVSKKGKNRNINIVDEENILDITPDPFYQNGYVTHNNLNLSSDLHLTLDACGNEVTKRIPIYCKKTNRLELRHRKVYNLFKESCLESCIEDDDCITTLSSTYVRKLQVNKTLNEVFEKHYNKNQDGSINQKNQKFKRTFLTDHFRQYWRENADLNMSYDIVASVPNSFVENKIEVKSANFINGSIPDLFYIQYDFMKNALVHNKEHRDKTQELIFKHSEEIGKGNLRLIHSPEKEVNKKNGKAVFAYYPDFENKEQNKEILEKFDELNIRWDNARWSKMIEIQDNIEKTTSNIWSLIIINLLAFILVLIIKFMLRLKLELHLLGVLKCFGYSQGVIQYTYNVGNLLIIIAGFIIGFFPIGIIVGIVSNFSLDIVLSLFLSSQIIYGIIFLVMLVLCSIITTYVFINKYTEKENIYELIKYES